MLFLGIMEKLLGKGVMGMKVRGYVVVENTDVDLFEEDIIRYLDEGYQPYGNIVVICSSYLSERLYVQAMVKYEKEDLGKSVPITGGFGFNENSNL